MSLCPKCKTEYREGVTSCADCGSTLVEELSLACDQCVAIFSKEEEAAKFVDFLAYSLIPESFIRFIEEQEAYGVFVTEENLEEANKLFRAFDAAEAKAKAEGDHTLEKALQDAFLNEGSEEEGKPLDVEIPLAKVIPKSNVTYVKKEERYNDLKSTFYIFLIFGVAGLIFTLLNVFEVVSLFTSWLQFIILTGLSIAFIFVAIFSYKKSKLIFDEIDDEKEITETIKKWLSENITAESLAQFDNEEDPKEAIFLKKIDYIKQCLYEHYTFDNDAYVDVLIEEFYNENFE